MSLGVFCSTLFRVLPDRLDEDDPRPLVGITLAARDELGVTALLVVRGAGGAGGSVKAKLMSWGSRVCAPRRRCWRAALRSIKVSNGIYIIENSNVLVAMVGGALIVEAQVVCGGVLETRLFAGDAAPCQRV